MPVKPACFRFVPASYENLNRMIPPTTDPADKQKADTLHRWVRRQKEEAMRNLPKDLEVLPSPLLLEQMEREAVQRRSPPAPLAAHYGPAVKSSPSSRRKKRRRGTPSCVSAGEESLTAAAVMPGVGTPLLAGGRAATSGPASFPATAQSPRLAAPPPMSSSLTPARCSEATPEELEERLRIGQMERDYETAVRQFHCRPPSMPGLQGAAAAAEQSMPGLQGAAAAAEQSTPGLQGAAAAAEQSTPGLQGAAAAAEQSTPGLQEAAAAAEQPTPGLQPAVELSEGGLPPFPGPEHLLSFLSGVLTELQPDTHHDTPQSDTPHPDTPQPVSAKPDTPQPDTPQPVSARSDTPQPVSARSDTPQPVSARSDTPQPVSARSDTPQPDSPQPDSPQPVSPQPDSPQPVSARPDSPQPDTPQPVSARPDSPQPDSGSDPKSASTFSTRCRGRRKRDASVHATGGLCDASAPAHATEGLGDASAPAHATEGLCDASAPAHATEGLCNASAPAHATEGPCDASALAHVTEGPADASAPSLQGFIEKLVLVLASEPCDEGFEEEEPLDPVSGDFKGQFVLILASEPLDEALASTKTAATAVAGFYGGLAPGEPGDSSQNPLAPSGMLRHWRQQLRHAVFWQAVACVCRPLPGIELGRAPPSR
ncbi:hypothetical protein CRENBAI_021342 [Crenichthys baileyi]|uniref:Uncharacterized protein n=1 Tax=Crenichthys baileyi TaxID=28760 RepID=A0AAV9QS18_9TELE